VRGLKSLRLSLSAVHGLRAWRTTPRRPAQVIVSNGSSKPCFSRDRGYAPPPPPPAAPTPPPPPLSTPPPPPPPPPPRPPGPPPPLPPARTPPALPPPPPRPPHPPDKNPPHPHTPLDPDPPRPSLSDPPPPPPPHPFLQVAFPFQSNVLLCPSMGRVPGRQSTLMNIRGCLEPCHVRPLPALRSVDVLGIARTIVRLHEPQDRVSCSKQKKKSKSFNLSPAPCSGSMSTPLI